MTIALVALVSVLLGCAIVIIIQLAVIASCLGDMKTLGKNQITMLKLISANTTPHSPPEELP